jgi:hypothetical protein
LFRHTGLNHSRRDCTESRKVLLAELFGRPIMEPDMPGSFGPCVFNKTIKDHFLLIILLAIRKKEIQVSVYFF